MTRPREFDEDHVLAQAMRVFWQHGFAGASMSMLTKSMGLTKSSLYQAFESKEKLFELANARYHKEIVWVRLAAFAHDTPKKIAQSLLIGNAELLSSEFNPAGCLDTNAALSSGSEGERIIERIVKSRRGFHKLLKIRLDEALTAGVLPGGMSTSDAASYLITFTLGMSVEAKSGATRAELEAMARSALFSWPD